MRNSNDLTKEVVISQNGWYVLRCLDKVVYSFRTSLKLAGRNTYDAEQEGITMLWLW